MISYALPKDQNLKVKFVEVLERVTRPIMEKNNLILNCRLTCLLGYYIDILYKDQNDVFVDVIRMFIESLDQNQENLALAHQSADTLNTIINDNDIVPRIKPIIGDLLQALNPVILTIKIPEFFSFLEEIFKFYKQDLRENDVLNTIQHLVKRIEEDVTINKGTSSQENPFGNSNTGPLSQKDDSRVENTIAITKCWKVIMNILETDEFVTNFGDSISNELKYLFGCLNDPSRIDFDDEIVKSMKILMTKTHKVNEVMRIMFEHLGKTYEKYNYIYSELFD